MDINKIEIITEDDVKVSEGDLVYNYYDMHPGILEANRSERSAVKYDIERGKKLDLKYDIWLGVVQRDDQGNVINRGYLNGTRICSIGFARRRGFKDA